MNTRAHWAEDVPDLYGDPSQLSNYLTLPEVADRTSLSPNTLKDALSRPRVTRTDTPMFALSRPAARVGNQPYYSQAQVDEALKIAESGQHRHLGGGDEPLPSVTAAEAERTGLISTVEIAEFANVHEQTVRRWVREQDSFPRAVALRARSGDHGVKAHPGVPIVVRELEAVQAWLRNYIETNEGKRIERLAAHLRDVHGWKISSGIRPRGETVDSVSSSI